MPGIASAATSIVIAHVAAGTKTIRVGAGGIMLPNHAPLVVAEQFGTLESLFPGRIDLGLGRAPGSDPVTARAMRRTLHSDPDDFPHDVLELMSYFHPEDGQMVRAIPGSGLDVPIWILGSSLFGAQIAAMLGLPFAFASHFAAAQMMDAIAIYRERFTPSAQLEQPYLIAGAGAIAAESAESAAEQFEATRVARAKNVFNRGDRRLSDEEAESLLRSPQGAVVDEMFTYTGVGTADQVAAYLDGFQEKTGADELITVHLAGSVGERVRSVELLGGALDEARKIKSQ